MSKKIRGFEPVGNEHIKNVEVFTDEKGKKIEFKMEDVQLPTRNDKGSAGYDFYVRKEVTILPMQKTIIHTDVKAYMPEDEVLLLFARSSVAHVKGLLLSTGVSVIDSSYYGNEDNDGNILLAVVNSTGKAITLKAGDRICQGVFVKYGVVDNDEPRTAERAGGMGSSDDTR